MPAISMCSRSDCPLRSRCYRNKASGTRPAQFQAWASFEWKAVGGWGETACDHYWPIRTAAERDQAGEVESV